MRLLALALLVAVAGCGGGGGPPPPPEQFVNPPPPPEDDPTPLPPPPPAPPPPPPAPKPPGSTTTGPMVPHFQFPPVGLTWQIGLTENVSLAKLQSVYASFAAMSSVLWDITEGQVYLYKLVVSDGVGPGTTPMQWEANKSLFDTSALDVVVWPRASWNLAGTAGVTWWSSPPGFGRVGRIILVPDDATTDTLIHEAGHLIWNLSWAASFGLEDEYLDGAQDPACIMEATGSLPTRWCSPGNHVNQIVQPHSCWTQILADYAFLTHTAKDVATTPAWVPLVTYNDKP